MGPGGMAPNPDFLAVVEKSFPRDTRLVVGCKAGGRSAKAAAALEQAGFTNVVDQTNGYEGTPLPTGGVEPGLAAQGPPDQHRGRGRPQLRRARRREAASRWPASSSPEARAPSGARSCARSWPAATRSPCPIAAKRAGGPCATRCGRGRALWGASVDLADVAATARFVEEAATAAGRPRRRGRHRRRLCGLGPPAGGAGGRMAGA